MRASQPFFGKKPAAGRQNSAFFRYAPSRRTKGNPFMENGPPGRRDCLPGGPFFLQDFREKAIWKLRKPSASSQKSWQKAPAKAGPLPPFQKARCQRKRLTLIACGEPKGNRKAFGPQRTRGMTEEKPAKKASAHCLRRAKGKQKSLWPTANQRHDRRKTSEKGQRSLPAASQRETEKPLAHSEPKA